MAWNTIGNAAFIALHGEPILPKRELLLRTRLGVNAIGVLRTGTRGEPFQLSSSVDAPDFPTGVQFGRWYEAMVGSDPVSIVFNDCDLSNYGCFFLVLNVRQIRVRAIQNSVGGLFDPAYAFVTAVWDLVAVQIF